MSKTSQKLDPSQLRSKLFEYFGFSAHDSKLPGLTMTQVFFDPDETMLQWLLTYARGRLIMDLGCGSGELIKRLKRAGGRVGGVEPHWDTRESQRYAIQAGGGEMLQVMPSYIEEPGMLPLFREANDILFLVCRPSHGGWPAYAAEQMIFGKANSEILLIQKEDTFYETRDMYPYDRNMRLIPHEGDSEDHEKVYSFMHSGNFPDNIRPGEDLFTTHHFDR